MGFPDTILERVSHLFSDGMDDILLYVLVFIFIFLSGQNRDENLQDEPARSESGFPIIIIVIFLFVFLLSGFRNESGEKEQLQ